MLKQTDERILGLAAALDSCFDGIGSRIVGLERSLGTRVEAMELIMDRLESRMNKIESRIDSIESNLRGVKDSLGALVYSRQTEAAK